jgi:tetratricopeptide (TPR) repeat protein
MSNIIDNIDNILAGYLTKKDFLEYNNLISNKSVVEKQYRKSLKKSKAGYSEWYYYLTKIELLISFAKRKLKKDKLFDMLFHLGDAALNRGEFGEAEKLFLYVISEVKGIPAFQEVEANTYLSLSVVYNKYTYWQKSLKYIKLARKIYMMNNNKKGIKHCDNLIGTIEAEKGNLKKAKAHFAKNLLNNNHGNDGSFNGVLEMNLGNLNTIQGDFDTALAFYKKSLVKFKHNGDKSKIADVEHNIGMLYTQKGEDGNALKAFNRSISLSLDSGNLSTLGLSYLQKAYILTRLKNFTLAGDLLKKSMRICTNLNDQLSIADIYKIKGIIERELKNFKAAENYLLASIKKNQALENKLNEAESNFELGLLYSKIGNQVKARRAFILAYDYFESIGSGYMIKKISEYLNLN